MTMPFTNLRPVRINRIKVKVRQLNTMTTVRDPDFREAKENRFYGQPVELIGQLVGAEPFFKLNRTATGDQVPSTGHALFRTTDLAALGITLKKGDRFVEFDGVPCDFNIIQVTKASPFEGNRQKSFARMILTHVSFEFQRKQAGSI